MIDELLMRRAIDALWHAGNPEWARASGEALDGGSFLLLSVRLEGGIASEATASERVGVARALNEVIPQHGAESGGSWMVVLKQGSALIDSIVPDEA